MLTLFLFGYHVAQIKDAGNAVNMDKNRRDMRIWGCTAAVLLLGGCAGGWQDRLVSLIPLGDKGDPAEASAFGADSFSGSLATAMAERGVPVTVTPRPQPDVRAGAALSPARPRPAVSARPQPGSVQPHSAARRVASLPPQPAPPKTQPSRSSRIVSIPLNRADDAHAEGLLRRAALLNSTYGGRIRLVPHGPDPRQTAAIARTAADELLLFGVPETQLVLNPVLPANLREARIDVLFEY
jgi:hypothetical protein